LPGLFAITPRTSNSSLGGYNNYSAFGKIIIFAYVLRGNRFHPAAIHLQVL
jgi:hypothetical protein